MKGEESIMIRGFSEYTGYNCLKCHHKCCGTEYDLPLLKGESINLQKLYSFSSNFIKKSKNIDYLIRGDSCIFLNSVLENGNLAFFHFPLAGILIFSTLSTQSSSSWDTENISA